MDRLFPCGENLGKQWQYQPRWDLWESVYNEDVAIDVPAGKHRIKVENFGKDWMRIGRYVFTGCHVVDRPNLLVAALRSPEMTLVWLQNRDSTWFNQQQAAIGKAEAIRAVPPARVTLGGFPDGAYQIQWWSTWKGTPTRAEVGIAQGGNLVLTTRNVPTDVAAQITPVK